MSVANRQPKLTTKETKKQKRKTIFSTTVSGSWYLLQVKHFPGDTSSLQLFGRFHPLERSRTPFFPKPVLDTNLDMLCLVRGFIGESVGEIWFMLIYGAFKVVIYEYGLSIDLSQTWRLPWTRLPGNEKLS